MLDPSWTGIDLLMFFLCCADDLPGAIEYDEAGACRSLVDCADISSYQVIPSRAPGGLIHYAIWRIPGDSRIFSMA